MCECGNDCTDQTLSAGKLNTNLMPFFWVFSLYNTIYIVLRNNKHTQVKKTEQTKVIQTNFQSLDSSA